MDTIADQIPHKLDELISIAAHEAGLHRLLVYILKSCRTISDTIRCGGYSCEKVGTTNEFGDNQLDVDVKTDAVLFGNLRESGLVHSAASEENPHEVNCGGNGFSVAFDPLDGSSIVDANFAVGTILGIWPGHGLLNRYGREQSASLVAQYGPRVTVALALNDTVTKNGQKIALELTMLRHNWVVSKPQLIIKPTAKTFAPGNLRATADNSQYNALVQYWIGNKYTLRYSGGLVPDVYHILIKGEGVLSNASSKSAKAKLRLLYECAPIALIVEAAQGASCVCPTEQAEAWDPISILDVQVTDMDKRVGVCFGSIQEIERCKSYLFGIAAGK